MFNPVSALISDLYPYPFRTNKDEYGYKYGYVSIRFVFDPFSAKVVRVLVH